MAYQALGIIALFTHPGVDDGIDLEPGAWTAMTTYNRAFVVPDGLVDPVVDAWVREQCDDAQRLVGHALRNHDTSIDLEYTLRPWVPALAPAAPISGQAGLYWYVRFILRGGRHLHPVRVVEEWSKPHA